jgi:hypothetical protein
VEVSAKSECVLAGVLIVNGPTTDSAILGGTRQ